MAQLRQDYQKFAEQNTEVIVVGPEEAGSFAEWWRKEKMPFPGIADPKHEIAKAWGQKVNLLKLGRMPALFIIDTKGHIRYQHFGESMSDIPTDDKVLGILEDLKDEVR